MKIYSSLFLLIPVIIAPLVSGAMSQNENAVDDGIIFGVLEMIDYEETDTIPAELDELIWNYYAEQTVDSLFPIDVLTYLEGIYSGRDFYETGNWGGTLKRYETPLQVYRGALPLSVSKDFVSPVEGYVTSPFGYRKSYDRMHYGLDIALSKGDTVFAALPGKVAYVGYDSRGYGRYIILLHDDDIETRYGHLNGSMVKKGDTVSANEAIGIGGNTGNSTGPHLHFEIRYRGLPSDPAPLFLEH